MLNLGNANIGKIYLGETEINKAYLGNDIVYSKSGIVLPDLSSISIYNAFALWRVSGFINDYPISVRVHDGVNYTSNENYVFFDNNDEISLSSKVSETTTPTSTSLGDLVGSSNADVTKLHDGKQGELLNLTAYSGTTVGKGLLIESGVIRTKAGKPSIKINGARYQSTVNSAKIISSNSFSMLVMGTANEVGGVTAAYGVSGNPNSQRIDIIHDERTVEKRIGFLRYTVGGTNYFADALSSYESSTPQVLIYTHQSGTQIKSYLNGVFQNATGIVSGTTNPMPLAIGGSPLSGTGPVNYDFQIGLTINTLINDAQASLIQTEFGKYYSL